MVDPAVSTTDAKKRGATRRAIEARRSLPNGRALVGALLITVAVVGAFAFANRDDSGPKNQYVVLSKDVSSGASITSADLALEPLTLTPELANLAFAANGEQAATTLGGLDGATALRFLHAGALLLEPDLRLAIELGDSNTANTHELTLPVPLNRTPHGLTRGDRVTILAYDSSGADQPTTWIALQDALVLGFETQGESIGSNSSGRLTLALNDASEVLRGAHLSFLDLSVVLSTRVSGANFPDHYQTPPVATAQIATAPIATAPIATTNPSGEIIPAENGETTNDR